MKTENTNQLFKVYAHYTRPSNSWRAKESDAEITKNIFEIFRTESGALVAVNKLGKLTTHFLIGEGHAAGRTFDEAQGLCRKINSNLADYFIRANTKGIDSIINSLDKFIAYKATGESICCSDIFYTVFWHKQNKCIPIREISNCIYWQHRDIAHAEELTLQDALTYKNILLRLKDAQIKRCNTYLKRYGAHNMYASSYWADR